MPRLASCSGLLLAALFLGAPRFAAAAEEAKPPADDSITANRRDLEAMRADRFLSPEQKLALPPGIDSPGLPALAPAMSTDAQILTSTSARKKAQDDLQRKGGKSANWLIEAMDKEKERSSKSPQDAIKSDRIEQLDLLHNQKGNEGPEKNPGASLIALDPRLALDKKAAQKESEHEREGLNGKKSDAMPNPLTGFMGSWMTPGDFTLLVKPDSGGGSKPPATLSDLGGEPGPAPGGHAMSFDRAALPGSDGGSLLSPGSAAPNPYLQLPSPAGLPSGAGLPADLAQRQVLEPIMAPAPPSATSFLPPPEAARMNNPLVPENLRPSEDAKYFPQLKRF